MTPQQLNLSPLQDNGGQTLTHALLAGSVAIDAVTDCTDKSNPPVALATDQRGVSRPQGAACDVGAFEAIPCTFTCPANITVLSDPNQCGAVVNYPAPTTTGDTCGTITCSPPSGAFFAIGTTTVSCNASGTATDPDCTFTVTVTDTQPPSITCPANIVGVATSPAGAVVNYSLPTVTDSCPGVGPPGCNPPSGSTFAIGVTTVNCTVSDAAGNSNACSFTVTVLTPAQAIQALIAGVQELVTAGALNPPQGTGLIAKLRDALDGLNRGNTRVACNKLADFISQVNALIGAGVLTSAEGVPLVQSATNIRNALGCS